MGTSGASTRKKVIHPYDPLTDLDAEVHTVGDHVPFIFETSTELSKPKFWADWIVQTTVLTEVSDLLEERGAPRFFTISAVIFGEDEDTLLVTDKSGARHRIPAHDVRIKGTRTTRH